MSVPLAYPVLLYVMGRMLWEGWRRRERVGELVPHAPMGLLLAGLVFLIGFRIGLNVIDSNVIDVGYSGVIGADRIADGDSLYDGEFAPDNQSGNVYGPVAYLAYLPWEQIFPWDGTWGDLPAAHAAAITFDLLTILGLYVLGAAAARKGARARTRIRLGRVPVHPLRARDQHERHARRGAARVGARRPLDPDGSRRADRARVRRQVRGAGARAALRGRRPAGAVRARVPRRRRGRRPPVPARWRPARLLRHDARLPRRAGSRPSASGARSRGSTGSTPS